MKKMTYLYTFAVLFFVMSAAIHILLSESPRITLYGDLIAVCVAVLPLTTVMYAFLYFEKGNPEKQVLLIFMVGLLFWLAGELLWFYYEVLAKTDPFPSLADGAWILGYPFVLAALILQYRVIKVRLEKKYEAGIAVLLIIAAAAMTSLFEYMIIPAEEFTFLEKAVTLFYPLADILLLYVALLITGLYWAGKLSHAWLLIAMGVVFYVAGDLWFAHLEWLEIYPEMKWHPVDFTWIIGDLLVFLGAARVRLSFEDLT